MAETDDRWKSSPAQKKSQQPFEVTGFSEVGGGGIEPPTSGFSIVVSGDPDSGASVEPATISMRTDAATENNAQQKAQHAAPSTTGSDRLSGVRKCSRIDDARVDPALLSLIDTWDDLPTSVRDRILRLAHNSNADDD